MTTETSTPISKVPGCDLASVIATAELTRRKSRTPDKTAEGQAEMELTLELAQSPHDFFQKLVNMVLRLTPANSAGISILNQPKGRFIWPAVAGGLSPYLWEGTPSDFGPCGTVLDKNEAILFIRPQRYFTYLEPINPPLVEVLLMPFYVDEKAVGTIWAVMHEPDGKFDAEDRRLLLNLSAFATTAYKVLVSAGAVESIMAPKA